MNSKIIQADCAQLDPPTLSKAADVWFDDGNLLVVVGEKHFSVYAGILSAASPIFRDIVQVSKNSQQDHIDGRPVVHLTGDSAEDISFLLKAVHDIECVTSCPSEHHTPLIISSIKLDFSYHPLRALLSPSSLVF